MSIYAAVLAQISSRTDPKWKFDCRKPKPVKKAKIAAGLKGTSQQEYDLTTLQWSNNMADMETYRIITGVSCADQRRGRI